ncbi:MAG TPA: T9SS type A sorting domain-containing protein [Paludibacter sp.]|nr:T9SS type A sorting domain-containing protein [Paludibacter sp.]
MKHLLKQTHYLLLLIFTAFTLQAMATDVVSYAYDNAGNRISRKVVVYSDGLQHVKKSETPAPVEEQLGERTITVYPNPTKGQLAIDINGGDAKDELRIIIFDAHGKQLLNKKVEPGTTPINMNSYPVAYYILRVQAGEKQTEFKIIKQ